MHVSFRPYGITPTFRGGTLSANQLALQQALSRLPGVSAEKAEQIINKANFDLGSKDFEYRPMQVGELASGEVYVITRLNQLSWSRDKTKHYQIYLGYPPNLKKLTLFSVFSPDGQNNQLVAWNHPESTGTPQVAFVLSSRGDVAPKVNGMPAKDWLVIE
jgi:hypothetical protein